ncbi:molybdate ABC transporter permease subunit [Clostridium formicaceticum]|uniref:Molybdenum transport system permease n=1 Tax=Clostridium formicaceticum TaxID=1497 RepID=A0AAC9RMI9_9CLOT|nr:molybdate ABC transporter permease subunit [Clostridium formicaceticum]AOY76600.1 molybdenum ABC transporter permease subunit [Clostridium formicaceticum]ARE87020.1 Molybdenum transport system permease protein ModB [Clostridium formicaceticum]
MVFDLSPLWISAKTAFVATFFTFVLGIAAAKWMMGYQGRIKGFIDGVFTLPLVLPPTVVGFFLLLVFGKNGVIGKLLLRFGTTIIFSWPATVIAAVVVAFPLMYKTTRGALEQIDKNLIYAARTLGVSEWEIFWRIMLPLAWPGIAAGSILAFARALGEFGATLMIAGNIPGRTQTIPLAIFFAAQGGDMEQALIWVLLIVTISLAIVFFMNFWSEKQYKFINGFRGKA